MILKDLSPADSMAEPTAAPPRPTGRLRVAYLNPFLGQAEDQAFASLRLAAEPLGVDLVSLLPSELCEDAPFDFVISTTATVRKTTSHPTYLSAHAPRLTYFESEEAMSRVASYDGYFCIAPNLQRLFRHFAAAAGKLVVEPGFYYNSPQITSLAADIPALVRSGRLRLSYFGTNWERRAERLFQVLATRSFARFYGPKESWRGLPTQAYGGAMPFDGISVQRTYAESGVGLVCLSQEHVLDDVVSNRIFEISSVGAAAICPDTPWTREAFGDTVFYYDPFQSGERIAARVEALFEEVRAAPDAAAQMAAAARRIFEQRFSADRLLANALTYHAEWSERRASEAGRRETATIDVIIRTGGDRNDLLCRAIRSIARQSAGRYRLVVVHHGQGPLPDLAGPAHGRIDDVEIVHRRGANRSQALVAGLDHVRSQYFAILDDDDYLLRDHFLGLLKAMDELAERDRLAYCDILRKDEATASCGPLDNCLSILQEGEAWADPAALLGRFSSHCFLATSCTLEKLRFHHWSLQTAEDGLLIFSLLKHATPVHARGATCVYSQGREGASNFLRDPQRREDEVALALETAHHAAAVQKRFLPEPPSIWAPIYSALRRALDERVAQIQGGAEDLAVLGLWSALSDGGGNLIDDDSRLFVEVPLETDRLSGHGDRRVLAPGEVSVRVRSPWELSLVIDVRDYVAPDLSVMAVMTFVGSDQPMMVSAVDGSGKATSQTVLPGGADVVQGGVMVANSTDLKAVALQGTRYPAEEPLLVRSVHLGYRRSELAERFRLPVEDIAGMQARLHAGSARQVIGAPEGEIPRAMRRINIRSGGSIFREILHDGPFAQGAPRTIGTGHAAWDYFAQIAVPLNDLQGCARLRLHLRDVKESCYAMLVATGFQEVLGERRLLRGGKHEALVWFDAPAGRTCYLVLQALDAPRNRPVTIVSLDAFA